MNIDKFKADHTSILIAVTELKSLVKLGIVQNAGVIAKTLGAMSATITKHLASEDEFLYPMLASSHKTEVADLGKTFQQEMGGIAAAYGEFAGKWDLGSKIAADPESFRSDANNIFKALHLRVQRENQELYPLVEQL